jgi:hypothetical protein
MRGRYTSYTFVIEFLGGTYVHQARGQSPEQALRSWLRIVCSEEFEWGAHIVELMRALLDQSAVPIEGCHNVWCMSGMAGDHLFLIHIVGTDSASEGNQLAESQQMAADSRRWGRGDR